MTTPGAAGSAWAPFRHEAFAALWGTQFVSNVGSWMQTAGAQWLMLALTGSTAYVALIQTAASLPIVLFAVLAGALGDLVARRRFLLVTQALMLLAAAALGALAIAGLVSPEERPRAISLGAVNQNLARAVGPAIGGIILAATSAGTVFLINAATFLAVLGVLVWWRGDASAHRKNAPAHRPGSGGT
jgi:MFS family permease